MKTLHPTDMMCQGHRVYKSLADDTHMWKYWVIKNGQAYPIMKDGNHLIGLLGQLDFDKSTIGNKPFEGEIDPIWP